MSQDQDKPESNGTEGTVGYRRPPPQFRFKRGVSGNPNGRPRKSKSTGDLALSIQDMLLEEAKRTIQLRENGVTIEMPVLQAVFRSLGVSAVRGDLKAQLALANLVNAAATQEAEQLLKEANAAMDYKEHWLKVFEDCDRRGMPRPEPIPHPAEIAINTDTLTVTYNGPRTKDEGATWHEQLKRRDELREEIALLEEELLTSEELRASKELRALVENEIAENKLFLAEINRLFPDVTTRRRPGFNLDRWREKMTKLHRAGVQRSGHR